MARTPEHEADVETRWLPALAERDAHIRALEQENARLKALLRGARTPEWRPTPSSRSSAGCASSPGW